MRVITTLGEAQYTLTATAPNGMLDTRTVLVSAVVFNSAESMPEVT